MRERAGTSNDHATLRFHDQLRPLLAQELAENDLPSRLVLAAQLTLGADGAGLSVIDRRLRVPVGASNAAASAAERLQFTLGTGPCLDAMGDEHAVRVDEEQMKAEWPAFHAELRDRSPFRSVVAVPLVSPSNWRGALDIYFTEPTMPSYESLAGATAIGAEIGRLLDVVASGDDQRDGQPDELPAWAYGPAARRRFRVWVAVGVLVVGLDLSVDDALARLRGYAYAEGSHIDTVAADVISGATQPESFQHG